MAHYTETTDNSVDSIDSVVKTVSSYLLSSHSLTVLSVALTFISLCLLYNNERSVGWSTIFTILTALQFLVMLWMFATAVTVVYDVFTTDDNIFDLLVALDIMTFYIISWTNIGMLFWVWDGSEDRSTNFTQMNNLDSSFSAWAGFFYMTVFIILGVGYGRYVAFTLLAEVWAGVLAYMSLIFTVILISTIVAKLGGRKQRNTNNKQL